MVKTSERRYYKYLDGYRLLAVCLVIPTHWLPSYFGSFHFSKIGVDMFFTLSGFLITEILLKQKPELNNYKHYKIRKTYLSFYVRRALRIFPIYYLTILLFLFFGAEIISNNLNYFLFYLSNVLVIRQGNWIGMFSHLWSLAIEEQFYIFWPIVVLSIPMRYLGKVISIIILLSLLFILYFQYPYSSITIFSCISTLAFGGLLAFIKTNYKNLFKMQKWDILLLSILSVIVTISAFNIIGGFFLIHFSTMLFSAYFIKILVNRNYKVLDVTFGNRIVSFLGKISY